MLRDGDVVGADDGLVVDVGLDDGDGVGEGSVEYGYEEWRDIDRELRSIAKRQAALDIELVRVLREAERVKLWQQVGCASMMEYLERVFGYAPRVAQERLRTSRRLASMPVLEQALAANELAFSAVRELTRVATPATAEVWREAARGKCLREIEDMVSGRAEGDVPTTHKRRQLETRSVTFGRVTTATCALEREARRALDAERGERLEDDAFLAACFQAVLEGGVTTNVRKARYQIVRYECVTCGESKQLGAGRMFDVDEAEAACGRCDAEVIEIDAEAKPTQDIPKRVRDRVFRRDGGRCRVPWCRSTRNLECHHLEHREDGGTHEAENLILACRGHHLAHHRGALELIGPASRLVVRQLDEFVEREAMKEAGAPVGAAASGRRAAAAGDCDASVEGMSDTSGAHGGAAASGRRHASVRAMSDTSGAPGGAAPEACDELARLEAVIRRILDDMPPRPRPRRT